MGPIVCATRGGEASRRTQEQAIALALEGKLPLIFLFVADINFAHPANEAIARALADELERLGKRLLRIAQSRAREKGIDAGIVVRRGSVRQVIEGFLKEVNAQTLILGAPQSNSEQQTFTPDELPQFAQEIQASTGVEVVVVT
jgi:nucleotide-binding universal stress UspA family protein